MRYYLLALTALLFSMAQAQSDPSGAVEFKPEQLDYNRVMTNQCRSQKIRAINNGNSNIQDPKFRVEGTSRFRVAKRRQKCPNPLEPGQACQVYIAFCPLQTGNHQATLFFSASEQGIPLTGRGGQPRR